MFASKNKMTRFSGFGYVLGGEHTYVSLLRGVDGECVELNKTRSRTVPNLFATDVDGNYLVWSLVKEVEKQFSSARGGASAATT